MDVELEPIVAPATRLMLPAELSLIVIVIAISKENGRKLALGLTCHIIPLNIWISKNTSFKDANSSVPAHGWLYDFENSVPLSNAWKLLKPETSEYGAVSTVIPILICSDDLDLVCNVIMIEQMVTESEVQWIRFGVAWNNMHDLVTSVVWEQPFSSPVLTFKLSDFEEAYNNLKSLDKAWNEGI